MTEALLTASAVLLDFAVGYAAGRLSRQKRRKNPSAAPKTDVPTALSKTMTEYRNFLCYDGTEQPDVE
jgi:hypothetical protein